MRDHKPGCPRLQFWDAGEWEAPCTCDDDEPERSDDMSATKDEMLLALADTCAGRGWTGHLAEFDAIRALIERYGDDKPGYPTAEEVEGAFKTIEGS